MLSNSPKRINGSSGMLKSLKSERSECVGAVTPSSFLARMQSGDQRRAFPGLAVQMYDKGPNLVRV